MVRRTRTNLTSARDTRPPYDSAESGPVGEADTSPCVPARVVAAGFADPVFAEREFVALFDALIELDRVAVAYSGGVDSAFLLRVAHAVLGDRATGVLAHSESLDRNEFVAARDLAASMGAPLEILRTDEYSNPNYRKNDENRCYHCKSELFDKVREFASSRGIPYVLDGSNADDTADYRPGLRAKSERGVRSPLLECGLNKNAIRRYSRALGLPTWDKPAAPCLASRIPYGSEVTHEKLRQVESAEAGLRSLGFRVLRVRHHGQVARVELPPEDLAVFADPARRADVARVVKAAGFLFVALDVEGFRSGSLNSALPPGTVVPVDSVSRLDSD